MPDPAISTSCADNPPPVLLRRLADADSRESLTTMLHRAFAPLAGLGLNCTGIDQSVEVTRQRIAQGECFVAVCDGRVVGTLTLHGPDAASESVWYHRYEVASIHQFAVDPTFQRRGVGKALLNLAEAWATARGYRELALETPHAARHLVDFYLDCGYRPVESVRFKRKQYVSLVLSKGVAVPSAHCANRPVLHLPRRHTDMHTDMPTHTQTQTQRKMSAREGGVFA